MSTTLYKPLGDNNEKIRLEAAKTLTTELLALIAGDRTEKAKSDIDYALKRLTKGLASGRESARPGFSVVLTETLTVLITDVNTAKWDISLDQAIETVKSNTQSQGHTKGQEERDYQLGRLFGLQSIIQSNILFSSSAALQRYSKVLDLLFELSRKKSWLQESCGWTIASSIFLWPLEISKMAADVTYQKLVESGFAKSGEGVGIWMALQAHHPDVAPPKDIWIKESPIATSNLIKLAKVLKESDSKDDPDIKSKGSWSPKLGYVWDYLFRLYFSQDKPWKNLREKKGAVADWAEFWRVAVDESLFSSSSSNERKYWGFLLFMRALDHVIKPEDLSPLFSRNFIRCLIYQLADSERYLNKLAHKVMRGLITKCESSPWMVPVIFKTLTSNNALLEQITRSKMVDKIIYSADGLSLSTVVDELKRIIFDPLIDETNDDIIKAAESRRQWAADQILSLTRNSKTVKTENWLRKVVELFATVGYFDILEQSRAPKIPISVASQYMFRSRLISCLTQLIDPKEGKMSNGESWPFLAVRTIFNMKWESHSKSAIEFDDTIEEAIKEAMATVAEIRKKRSSEPGTKADTQLFAFEILYSLIILQVYNGEPDALSVLEDLKPIQTKLMIDLVKKKKEYKDANDEELEIDSAEVLIDILISFLSRQSVLLKKVAHLVFTSFCDCVTKASLERCFDVLLAKEDLSGQQELFDKDDDKDDGDAEEIYSDSKMLNLNDDDDELDSDVEVLSASEDERNEGNDDAWKALEKDLNNLIQPPNGEEDDIDADMNDEEMLKMDEKIAEIFKRQMDTTSKKTQKKDAKELMVTFKSKVLELLEIYAKTSTSSPLALEILLPCLSLARRTRDQTLAAKSVATVKSFSHAAKRRAIPVISTPEQIEHSWILLQEIHTEAGRGGTVARRSACSVASLLLVRSLVNLDITNVGRVSELYSRSLTQWATNAKFGADNSFFNDWVGWVSSVRGELAKKQKQELEIREDGPSGKKEEKNKRKKRSMEEMEIDVEKKPKPPKANTKRKSEEPENDGTDKKKRKSRSKGKKKREEK